MNEPFLTQLARPQPNPGGGAAAAYGGAIAMAIVEKIIRLELERKSRSEEDRGRWNALLRTVMNLTEIFTRLMDADVEAYMALASIKGEAGQGTDFLAAVQRAVECPRQIVERGREASELVSQTARGCGRHLVSDLQVAREFLAATIRGALHIGKANRFLVPPGTGRDILVAPLEEAHARAAQALQETERVLNSRLEAPPPPSMQVK